ncbi:MAG: pilus assembly protein [Anaerolineae bacterium]|nr:pilus assembly protein [Anaerolineae bacterium]
MLRTLAKIVQILDDTPAIYGERRKGQSVVELALVTPILIILLAGLIEVGWFANNYLTLLDVTRAGARRGTVLQDAQSPLFWDERGSLVPQFYFDSQADGNYFKTAYDLNGLSGETDTTRLAVRYHPTFNPTGCNTANRTFYHEISCVMLASMDPLRMTPENGVDDIIISGVSIENVDASRGNAWLGTLGSDWRPLAANVPQLVVVGRYPTNANECEATWDGIGTPALGALEPRDPFDFNYSGDRDVDDIADETFAENNPARINVTGEDDFDEIVGMDVPAANLANAEKQVGFVLFGNHRITGTACVGSEWTLEELSRVVNLSSTFELDDYGDPEVIAARRMIPGQGIIMVEMFWQHRLLLNIPVLSPVFVAIGSERATISVWAAFPLPAVEPFISFD